MAAAQRTALWRATLRAQLGEQAYLQRQRDMKKRQRARIKARQTPPLPVNLPDDLNETPPPLPQTIAPTRPPRPPTRPSAEVVRNFLGKTTAPIPPRKLSKLNILMKMLNNHKDNKND